MTSASPEANAEHTAGNGMPPAQEGHGQAANTSEEVRLDRDLDAELASLLKQLQDPTPATAAAIGEHKGATFQNEEESTVAHPSTGGASSSSSGATDRGTPEGLKEDAAPAESGGSFDDGAARGASAAEVGARTALGTGGRTKKGAPSWRRKEAGPSSSATSAAVAKEKIAAKEVTPPQNVPPPHRRPQLRARVGAAQGKRTVLSRATKATTASKTTTMGHTAKDGDFSEAHPLLGISSASTSKAASTASAKPDTPVLERRFPQQRLKATSHMPRQRRPRPSPTGGRLSVGRASEGLTGEVSLSTAIPTKAGRHPVAKAIRSAIAAVAESVVSAATASDKQSGIAAAAGTTPRGSTRAGVYGAQEGSVRVGEKFDLRQTGHAEDAGGATIEDPQLTRIPGAERKPLVERRNHPRTAAPSRRPGRPRTKVEWRRTCGVAPTSDYDGLDFRWGMYPQDRRWNEEDLRYSYVDVLASPPHPVYAGPAPPALFGCRGPASSKGISSAPLCSSDGIANALPYRTLYERPANYIVGMQYDTHYQLPTLSRLLHARQPEFLQHSLAAAEHVKHRRQHCSRAPRPGRGPLCAPLNMRFRLNLQFPNEKSCPPLEIQGKLYRTPGGKYKFSIHSAKRTGSRAARVPETPQSWKVDGSAPAYVYRKGEDTRKESDSIAATPVPGVITGTDARKRQTRGYGVRMADSAMLHKDGYVEGEEDTGITETDAGKRQTRRYGVRKADSAMLHRRGYVEGEEETGTPEADAGRRQTRGYGVRMADSAMVQKDGYVEGEEREEDTGSDAFDEEQFDESEQEDTGRSDFFAESDYAEAPQRSEENDHCDQEVEYTGYVEGTVSLSWQPPEAPKSSARQNQPVKTLW